MSQRLVRRAGSFALVLACVGLASTVFADDSKEAKATATKEAKSAASDPVAVAAALKRTDQAQLKALPEGQAGNDGTAIDVSSRSAGVTTQDSATGLADVHGTTKGQAVAVAGSARDVAVKDQTVASAPKPQASPRQLRRMNVERVVVALGPAFQTCADSAQGTKPTASSSAVVVAEVSPTGSVDVANVATSSGVSTDVLACVAREVRGAKFGAPGGVGATVAVPVAFARAK